MSDKSQTPTGVFVRLPLSEDQRMTANEAPYKKDRKGSALEASILSIGTPVTGGDLHEVGIEVVHTHGSDLTYCRDHAQKIANGADGIIYSLVRQSDHQAALAAAQAEIVRLRESAELARESIKAGSPMKAAYVLEEALKGPEA